MTHINLLRPSATGYRVNCLGGCRWAWLDSEENYEEQIMTKGDEVTALLPYLRGIKSGKIIATFQEDHQEPYHVVKCDDGTQFGAWEYELKVKEEPSEPSEVIRTIRHWDNLNWKLCSEQNRRTMYGFLLGRLFDGGITSDQFDTLRSYIGVIND